MAKTSSKSAPRCLGLLSCFIKVLVSQGAIYKVGPHILDVMIYHSYLSFLKCLSSPGATEALVDKGLVAEVNESPCWIAYFCPLSSIISPDVFAGLSASIGREFSLGVCGSYIFCPNKDSEWLDPRN